MQCDVCVLNNLFLLSSPKVWIYKLSTFCFLLPDGLDWPENFLSTKCVPIWWPSVCFLDNDECISGDNTCDQYAKCNNEAGTYSCECLTGLVGDGHNCTGKIAHNIFQLQKNPMNDLYKRSFVHDHLHFGHIQCIYVYIYIHKALNSEKKTLVNSIVEIHFWAFHLREIFQKMEKCASCDIYIWACTFHSHV